MKINSWQNKPIFTEIILLFMRQTTNSLWSKALSMSLTIWNFCLVIKLTMGGNWAVSWPPINFANRNVTFATTSVLELNFFCR